MRIHRAAEHRRQEDDVDEVILAEDLLVERQAGPEA